MNLVRNKIFFPFFKGIVSGDEAHRLGRSKIMKYAGAELILNFRNVFMINFVKGPQQYGIRVVTKLKLSNSR
jgi:hypothetical protein